MPEVFGKTYKFMTYADYILSKLGAEPVIDFTMASRTMAFELAGKKWSEKILDKVGVNPDTLSKAVPSGEVVGEMDPKLSDELGISRGTLLVAGGHDQTCAALGAGAVAENIAVDSHGTADKIRYTYRGFRQAGIKRRYV